MRRLFASAFTLAIPALALWVAFGVFGLELFWLSWGEAFLSFLSFAGVNLGFWGAVGCLRYLTEASPARLAAHPTLRRKTTASIKASEVAAVMAAHNEEAVLGRTLTALRRVLPPQNIYVGSDASTDRTVEIARAHGCYVEDIRPNKGKAGVLEHMIGRFALLDGYKALVFVDADTLLDRDFLKHALPFFDDRKTAALGGHTVSDWPPHAFPRRSLFFMAYRTRLWFLMQVALRYGQSWKYVDVSSIVPGSYGLYRTSVLRRIAIKEPGLLIEDFNMSFQIHQKRLGRIAYHPSVFGIDHEPLSLRDYCRQTERWGIGFWQTVGRRGMWMSWFWLALSIFLLENYISGILLLFLLPLLLYALVIGEANFMLTSDTLSFAIDIHVPLLILGFFLMDYLVTVLIATVKSRPLLLVYGLLFPLMRLVDSFLFLRAIPKAFLMRSSGIWRSPKRTLG